jgi:hypothetical protein
MTKTELARRAIIGCQIRQRLTAEQMDCIRKLSGMGNNLNQIARRANAEGYTNVRSEYLYLADGITTKNIHIFTSFLIGLTMTAKRLRTKTTVTAVKRFARN